MASTEKELELEGHSLWTVELMAETARILELARTHGAVLRNEGIELKDITSLDQLREMVNKEHLRVEVKPPKEFKPTKEQERLLARAFQWRANLVRRADKAFVEDRMGRQKYRRCFLHHRLPERVYEELMLLLATAKNDMKKLQFAKVDEALLLMGEDLCYELQNLPVPNRLAQVEYEQKMAQHRYGPPPTPPEPIQPLPQVNDSAKNISIMKGRLFLALKIMASTAQVAFNMPKEPKDHEKWEAIRKEFMLRVKGTEEDEELVSFGKFSEDKPGAVRAAAAKAAVPAPAAPAVAATPAPPPKPTVTPVNPGGATPPPPSDPSKKPPARAVGLVRPSITTGSKSSG